MQTPHLIRLRSGRYSARGAADSRLVVPLLSLMLCALLMNFGGCGGPAVAHAEETLPAPLRGVRRIVCLGDSITQGGEQPGGYVWLLRHYLGAIYPETKIEVINAGISGHRSSEMLARFQKDVLDQKPDLVTISVGVNDVWHGYRDFVNRRDIPNGDGPNGIRLADYRRNVEEMLRRAKSANIKLVVLSTTPIYEDLDSRPNQALTAYNLALRDLARKHGGLFVDFMKPFQTLIRSYREMTGARDNLLTTDGVHMNPAGYRLMANTLLHGLGVSAETRLRARDAVELALRTPR